ncbi:MAG: Gfo/Idh/MocA family oxidoreductase [Planctomycetes bacterium]|nr:Gfo/Idh/MocA family oxidoreductase [Planctomycetota bacterium]
MPAETEQLQFGICGLGFMGRTYFAHLSQHEHARVAALCDRDPERCRGNWTNEVGNIGARAGEQNSLTGIRSYAAVDELLADKAVHAVAVTVPTPLHAELTVRALHAGKHVLCEKPMALTLADCDRMIAAATDTGRTLMVAQCIRFWPQYETIKRLVDEGQIGPVRFATLRRLANPPRYSAESWLLDDQQSGGALFDLHIHDIDFAQHLLGTPAAVFARGSRGPSGGIDHLLATYTYGDGRYALVEGGWAFHKPWPFEMAITVHGETGTLDWSLLRGPEVLWYRGGDEPERISVADENGWTRELDYFVECVRDRRPVARCTPASARTSIALALAEHRALTEGAPAAPPQSGESITH